MTKTYIYHGLIGQNNKVEEDIFLFARNAKNAKKFCQNLYKNKHYNYYKFIKIGISHYTRETQLANKEDETKFRKYTEQGGDFFSEKYEIPQFVSPEKVKEF